VTILIILAISAEIQRSDFVAEYEDWIERLIEVIKIVGEYLTDDIHRFDLYFELTEKSNIGTFHPPCRLIRVNYRIPARGKGMARKAAYFHQKSLPPHAFRGQQIQPGNILCSAFPKTATTKKD
jgi:hypothetical protein